MNIFDPLQREYLPNLTHYCIQLSKKLGKARRKLAWITYYSLQLRNAFWLLMDLLTPNIYSEPEMKP